MITIDFTEQLIKGKLAEIIFEMMFRQAGYTITHFGYEYTASEFIREDIREIEENKAVLKEIRHSPDFLVITPEKHTHFVEVKFRSHLQPELFLKTAQQTNNRWSQAWFFVATHDGFFFNSCQKIIEAKGEIAPLKAEVIPVNVQLDFLELLNKYIQ